jgi:hypothetical protein
MPSYIRIPEKVKTSLKKPFGEIYSSLEQIKKLSLHNKIVSVGDLSTLVLLSFGIRPHLAVFDFRYHRRKLEPNRVAILKREFRHVKNYKNRKGTLSTLLMRDAKMLLRKGGAVKVDGEEDLTALVFIKNADKRTIVVYGQPKKGIVVVRQDRKTREKISKIFKEIGLA